jgi:hypothetical protein
VLVFLVVGWLSVAVVGYGPSLQYVKLMKTLSWLKEITRNVPRAQTMSIVTWAHFGYDGSFAKLKVSRSFSGAGVMCVEENVLFGQASKLNQVCQHFYFWEVTDLSGEGACSTKRHQNDDSGHSQDQGSTPDPRREQLLAG